MSQASNHVKWCLNKATKEIKECKKLGKKPTHRGLLKAEPDTDEARKHLAKAEHNFKAINRFKEIGFSDWSISAGFYCIYQCFLAIAIKFGYESRNQTCTIALMKYLREDGKIDIDMKFIDMLEQEELEKIGENKVIGMREDYTYGVEISVEDETKINDLIKTCKKVIDATKEIIFK